MQFSFRNKPELQSHKFIGFLLTLPLFVLIIVNTAWMAEPEFIPLDQESIALLLQKTLEQKLVPYQFKADGLTLSVHKLRSFSMDWEKNRFQLACDYSIDYRKLMALNYSGMMAIRGAGLVAPDERKLGAKILGVEELRINQAENFISDLLRLALDQSIAGMEIWQGTKPAASELLTKENYPIFIKTIINQNLPITGNSGSTSFTMNEVAELTRGEQPGSYEVAFRVKGSQRWLFNFPYEGIIKFKLQVLVNPSQLKGLVRVERVTALRLRSYGFLNGIIRSRIGKQLAGKELEFAIN